VHHEAILRDQLLLLEDDVNPVMITVLNAGLEITGLADSSTFDGPRLKMLDVTGVGAYQSLASAFRKALDEFDARVLTQFEGRRSHHLYSHSTALSIRIH